MTNFMMVWSVTLSPQFLPSGRFFAVCLQVCWVSHFLASYNQGMLRRRDRTMPNPSHGWDLPRTCYFWRICNSCAVNYRELFWRKKPRDVCHHVITFLNPRLKPTLRATAWKKSHFNRRLGSIVGRNWLILIHIWTLGFFVPFKMFSKDRAFADSSNDKRNRSRFVMVLALALVQFGVNHIHFQIRQLFSLIFISQN